jgi:predicted Zn-dependent protease
MPSNRLAEMGNQSFNQMKENKSLSQNKLYQKRTRCITDRLLIAIGKNPKEWKVQVFQDETPNAFALPGGNMGVHTGMIELVKNNDQLAAVMGHEIGHVLADHGNERVSQGLVTQVGLTSAQLALGMDSTKDQFIFAALGLGAQFGVLMPFSRHQESEADSLGLKYMALAGFDPREASELWRLMGKGKSVSKLEEFLSTHPSPDSRVKELSASAPSYLTSYNANRNKEPCP